MKSKIIFQNSYEWITKRLLIYFVFWIWGFLLVEVSAGCPKVCQCKWKGGKQWVSCSSAKFIDIPQGLEPSTQVLNLEHNNLKILFRDAFVDRGLVNLQKVLLTFCNLRKLERGSLRKLANLVKLDVSNNFLTFIPVQALSDVPDLRELSIKNNSLSFVPPDAFKDTPELVHLDLSNNKIKSIGDRAFSSLVKLEVLDLSGNNLRSLTVHVLQPLDSLHGLYIHANRWYCNCFLRPLRQWMLERNIAASIPPTCFHPERLKERLWDSLDLNEFVCVPHVTPVAPRVLASHGDNVSLACRVETDDEALVTWLIGDKAVAKGDYAVEPRYKVLELLVPDQGNASRVSNLTISGADSHDQGIYRCVVENKAGRVETNFTLKVSEFISDDPLVEIDQVFVAGALLGGLAFVFFAIFIACAVFYKRKRRHAQNIARMTSEMCETPTTNKITEKPDAYKVEGHPGYAEYQIIPTNDNESEYADYPDNRKEEIKPSPPKLASSDFYNRVGDSEHSKTVVDVQDRKYKLGAGNAQPLDFTAAKPSLGAEEPLLHNLAQQCKNEALKRKQTFRDAGNVFNAPSNVRFPDLLTSQTSDFRYCTIPRG
ncbi:UNVERIFIED_CONTAM: hypothetical protein GTU68_064103 [Idotea baltica]|nr:hypothetical protein [Idotea baltica]